MIGHFEGTIDVRFLDDGRIVELLSDLAFVDPQNLRWAVPKGAQVDGASIPRGFWSLIGGPFEGKYRDASVVHDWYCDQRTHSWQATHRVFYDGMIARGVEPLMAKLMYYAVWWGGPRWEARVSHNTNLGSGSEFRLDAETAPPPGPRPMPSPGRAMDMAAQADVAGRMHAYLRDRADLPLDAIERLAEQDQPPG